MLLFYFENVYRLYMNKDIRSKTQGGITLYGKIKGKIEDGPCPIFCGRIGQIVGEDEVYYKLLLLDTKQTVYIKKEHVELIPYLPSKQVSSFGVTDKVEFRERVVTNHEKESEEG